ncbi:histidinol dehydrogenase [Actinobaculum suis]|uniref:histidinol dehydrogenase n=1 Tax=Actinobaculum suis TaxID=1657 RepID=UPI00080879F4|nr:histidinol dehydrogenase [Actinobaculum suis]OCA93273.1 histidinol dehydrogenase [Actinobaculum suis]OCA94427.1 histidinol dehydrogenase [Actinobaculum suis]
MNAAEFLAQYQATGSATDLEVMSNTLAILEDVKKRGDAALREYTSRFDGEEVADFLVPEAQLQASWEGLEPELQEAMVLVRSRIENYEQQIREKNKDLGEISYVLNPVQRVGLYIPGGTALYPSSVLMTVVAAQVAGVKEFYAVTPMFDTNNITFATLYFLGIKNVYRLGGAQAIGALAYGTQTIPKVDMIVGPGNAYVAAAKRIVYGEVGIDSVAGPSEVLVYTDGNAQVDDVAYEILAQAEHDVDARTYLLSESADFAAKVSARIADLVGGQKRAQIIAASLENCHYTVVDSRENLLEVANRIAAEHVSVLVAPEDAAEITEAITYAGAIFVGPYAPVAIGDYIAGPSHVLPTASAARFSNGLNVNSYLHGHAVIQLGASTYADIAPAAKRIAREEGLFAHKASLAIREKRAAAEAAEAAVAAQAAETAQ